jgi:hypothetical protein
MTCHYGKAGVAHEQRGGKDHVWDKGELFGRVVHTQVTESDLGTEQRQLLTGSLHGSSQQGCADLGGERPSPSIARFGRLAYPTRGEATNRALLGCNATVALASEWVSAVGTTWVLAFLGCVRPRLQDGDAASGVCAGQRK